MRETIHPIFFLLSCLPLPISAYLRFPPKSTSILRRWRKPSLSLWTQKMGFTLLLILMMVLPWSLMKILHSLWVITLIVTLFLLLILAQPSLLICLVRRLHHLILLPRSLLSSLLKVSFFFPISDFGLLGFFCLGFLNLKFSWFLDFIDLGFIWVHEYLNLGWGYGRILNVLLNWIELFLAGNYLYYHQLSCLTFTISRKDMFYIKC